MNCQKVVISQGLIV